MRLSKCALVLSLLWLFNMLHSVIVEGVKCLICSDASAGRLISENKCHVERSGLLRCQHKEIKRRNARRRCSNSFCSAILEFSSHPWILSCGFLKEDRTMCERANYPEFLFLPTSGRKHRFGPVKRIQIRNYTVQSAPKTASLQLPVRPTLTGK